jgi:hypothetical protein
MVSAISAQESEDEASSARRRCGRETTSPGWTCGGIHDPPYGLYLCGQHPRRCLADVAVLLHAGDTECNVLAKTAAYRRKWRRELCRNCVR